MLKCLSTYIKLGEKLYKNLEYKQVYNHSRCYSDKYVNNKPWSVLFFGTDEFALRSLKALNNSYKNENLLRRLEIVTNYKGEENAVIKYARRHKLIIHSWPPKISDKEFEIGIVVSFGHLIPTKIIKLFPLGMINVHGSLLPKWRGAAPICHCLMNGDTRTGITIMTIMPKRFDVGSVILQKEIDIHPDETYIDLYNKLAVIGADVLIETINKLPNILKKALPQDEKNVTYAPKITMEMSFVRWKEMTATNIYNLQRALTGIEPLRAYFNNIVVKLFNVKVENDISVINCKENTVPGLAVYNKIHKKLYISCKDNSWISVEKVIIPNRKPQSASDFGCGFILNRKEKFCLFN